MFLDNKYTKIYFRLIDKAKLRTELNTYSERHHIIPKCIRPDLAKIKSNIVRLTPKEHYIAHLLLTKMVTTEFYPKIFYAFGAMSANKIARKLSSRQYEKCRTACMIRPIWNKGIPMSEESKKKVSDSKKGSIPWNKGKTGQQVVWNKGKKNIYTKERMDQLKIQLILARQIKVSGQSTAFSG